MRNHSSRYSSISEKFEYVPGTLDYSDPFNDPLHGACQEWIIDNYQPGDKILVIEEVEWELDDALVVGHCVLIRNGRYLDARGFMDTIDEVLAEYDFDDTFTHTFDSLEKFIEYCDFMSEEPEYNPETDKDVYPQWVDNSDEVENTEVIDVDGLNEDINLYKLFPSLEQQRDKNLVKDIDAVSKDAHMCRVRANSEHVWAGADFHIGDIIERCPVHEISQSALYSRDMRDIAFSIGRGRYVVPMGYVQFYDILDSFNLEANCDWKFDFKRNELVIQAIKRIKKGDKLILNIKE